MATPTVQLPGMGVPMGSGGGVRIQPATPKVDPVDDGGASLL